MDMEAKTTNIAVPSVKQILLPIPIVEVTAEQLAAAKKNRFWRRADTGEGLTDDQLRGWMRIACSLSGTFDPAYISKSKCLKRHLETIGMVDIGVISAAE